MISSPPFERLLLERARPVVAHAEAGHDFVVASLGATAYSLFLLMVVYRPAAS